ncbi:MAG: patatin-like phospholipase family protein, partial [Hyphomicrobiaceae bacterium]
WTESGRRPRFDIVTGVSAGSIIAPFAFLGPKWDPALKVIWTRYQTDQLATAQILPAIFGGPALADTTKLRNLISQYVTASFLRSIAREYEKGRILLVGTTNLDAQRPVFWNMGEIAKVGTPQALQLFRDVILGSAAIPGVFPPVHIQVEAGGRRFEEMHVDGGTTRDIFIAPYNLNLSAFDKLYASKPKRHIYIIMNGKMSPEFEPVKPSAVDIGARAVSTLIKAHDDGDLYRIRSQALASGSDFHFVAIPNSFKGPGPRDQVFDPVHQAALFEKGREMGRRNSSWNTGVPTD